MHFSRAWCVRQQDPVQEALRSVCGKNRQRFRVKKAFCFFCKRSFVLFPQSYAARYPVSQCGSVVTVAGEISIFPARLRQQDPVQEALRSVCGKTRHRFRLKKSFCFLCRSSFVLFPQTYAARYISCPGMRQCCNSCGRNVHFSRAWCVRQQNPVQEALRQVCG